MADRTVTATRDEGAETAGLAPALIVAWHPDPERLGQRRRVPPGTRVELGRGGAALGPGALDDDRISGRHAEVTCDAEGLSIRDLGSRNGTFVGGRPVDAARLPAGSVVGIGRVWLVVEEVPAAWRAPRVDGWVGESAAVAAALAPLEALTGSEAPVLIRGPTGTGKELVARELHRRSGRKGPFLAVNCAAFDAGVLQSELFGHERGAFSGADRPRRGLIEEASAGTLFLDEIAEAPAALQASLLRVLQEKEVRPVGGNRSVPVGTRFLAATHQDLEARMAAGTFRSDLYARLAGWELTLPPLSARRSDVPRLAEALASARAGRPLRLSGRLAGRLLLRDWPRNVRELAAVVDRAVALATEGDQVGLPDGWPVTPEVAPAPFGGAPAGRVPEAPRPRPARPAPEALRALIAAHGGNRKATAAALGVGRATLYRWLAEDG